MATKLKLTGRLMSSEERAEQLRAQQAAERVNDGATNSGQIHYAQDGEDVSCTCGSNKFTLTANCSGVDVTCAVCGAFLSMTW